MTEIAGAGPAAAQVATQTAAPTRFEADLFSYMAHIQAQGLATGQGAALANPAILSGQVFRYLRGFVDRSGAVHKYMDSLRSGGSSARDHANAPAHKAEGVRLASLDAGTVPLHGGPAFAPLDGARPLEQEAEGSKGRFDDIVAESEQLMNEFVTIAWFHAEASAVSNGSRKMVDDVNMLIKAQ